MAKFFLTNNTSVYQQLKQRIKESPFKLSFDYSDDNVYALAVHKLTVDNCNYAQNRKDFAMAVGTCIYKEAMDYAPLLRDIYEDVQAIRNQTIGQYGVCCKKGNECFVYSDCFACFDVFYYKNSEKWLISNSLYDMAMVLHNEVSLDPEKVAVFALNPYGLLNGATYFHEIKRLQRDEFIKISLSNKSFTVNQVELPLPVADDTDFDKMVKATANALRENARISAKVFGAPTVCVTGGLDSRILLASYLSAGVKPILLSGKRVLAGKQVEKEDNKVARMYVKKYNLPIVDSDFSWADPVDRDWDEMISTYGFTALGMWTGQKTILNSLIKDTSNVVTFGWGGEPYREDMRCKIDLADDEVEDIEKLLRDYYISNFYSVNFLYNQLPEYDKGLSKELQLQSAHFGVKHNPIKAEEMWLLTIAGEAQGDYVVPICLQMAKYCYLPLFEYNALKNRVHPSLRKNAKFMLAVMRELCPTILDIPFYSRQAWNKIDKENLTLHQAQTIVDVLYNSTSWIREKMSGDIKERYFRPIKRAIYRCIRPSKEYPIQNISNSSVSDNSILNLHISDSDDPVRYYDYEFLKRVCAPWIK